ncbi:hypothetical protein HG530_007005 [Fusarium avenaceum]|nr:hypothetical protein HG530_007005 [Fusarium avenaceum]
MAYPRGSTKVTGFLLNSPWTDADPLESRLQDMEAVQAWSTKGGGMDLRQLQTVQRVAWPEFRVVRFGLLHASRNINLQCPNEERNVGGEVVDKVLAQLHALSEEGEESQDEHRLEHCQSRFAVVGLPAFARQQPKGFTETVTGDGVGSKAAVSVRNVKRFAGVATVLGQKFGAECLSQLVDLLLEACNHSSGEELGDWCASCAVEIVVDCAETICCADC